MKDLFESAAERPSPSDPLADRMRPRTIEEVVGQEHILGEGKILRRLVESDRVPSLVLWGPPGTGKTTIARLIAKRARATFHAMSAVLSGVADLKEVIAGARRARGERGERTILFVDEIHRWSKSQQDALLEAVERGVVTLIGATTENPSFELNSALLSRTRVFVLEALGEDALVRILRSALGDRDRGLGASAAQVEDDALSAIARGSFGDARKALGALEIAVRDAEMLGTAVTKEIADDALQHRTLLYDKAGDEHYGVVSAFIKSMRGSDPDAAVYYLVRMIESGEDPRFVIRRMVIFASEDVGNADPAALSVATSTLAAYELMGMPEGILPLTQCALYLASAPKSNTAVTAYARALDAVRTHGPLPVPAKLRNAATALAKSMGHGRGYRYPHDLGGVAPGETYLPDALIGQRFYAPTSNGEEREAAARLAAHRSLTPKRSPSAE
jgi:putative ATPase